MSFGDIDDDAEATPRRTALDFITAMQAEHKASAVRTVPLRDEQRPQFELTCRVPTDLDEILTIEKRAEEAAKQSEAPRSEVISACMSLARFTVKLTVKGLVYPCESGAVFADPTLQESLGTVGAKGAAWRSVRQLFLADGNVFDDGVIMRLNNALIDEAGITRKSVVVGEQDPT
jgi:hypothetical protein